MPITLHSESGADFTLISNAFIDHYMPEANGEFVKVYLYLLRCLGSGEAALTVSEIADKFNNTENDVCRALKYWEKLGLLKLETEEKSLTGIRLLSPGKPRKASRDKQPAASQETAGEGVTRERADVLCSQEDIKQLLFIVEQYIGRPLASSHVQTILYLYDSLHFSAELIEYLVEYCVSRGSKSFRYIESVALSWHEAHITTVEQAREVSSQYSKTVYSVLKSFGIRGRNPVESELSYIRKWTDDYGFTLEIIALACERTMSAIHQPSFEYADKILSRWQQQGVRHAKDISALDMQYQKNRRTVGKASSGTSASANKFNNFDQRSYDYDDLERQLLNIP